MLMRAIRTDDVDAAIEDGGDANVTIFFYGKAVEPLEPLGVPGEPARCPWIRTGLQNTGAVDLEGPEPGVLGLSHVERAVIRGQTNAVGSIQPAAKLADMRPVSLGVVQEACVVPIGIALAQIGEVEAALRVENEVVRAVELLAFAYGEEGGDFAELEIDALH